MKGDNRLCFLVFLVACSLIRCILCPFHSFRHPTNSSASMAPTSGFIMYVLLQWLAFEFEGLMLMDNWSSYMDENGLVELDRWYVIMMECMNLSIVPFGG